MFTLNKRVDNIKICIENMSENGKYDNNTSVQEDR